MPEDTTPPGRAVSGPRARRRAAPRSALRAGRAPGARKAEIPGGGGVGGKKGTAQSGQLGLGSAGSARLGHDEAAGVSGGRGEGSLPPLRARWGMRGRFPGGDEHHPQGNEGFAAALGREGAGGCWAA